MISGQLVSDRREWLAARMETIGASEAAAAVGVSPYQTPLELYVRKLGLAEPVEESMAMRLGNLLEPVILKLYEEEAGAVVERSQVYLRSEERTHLSATLDGITADGRIVEFKTMGSRLAGLLGEEGSDEIPDHWLLQAHQQCYVAQTSGMPGLDFSRVHFAVLVGGQEFKRFTVPIDEAVLATMLLKVDDFWGHVRRREPPPVSDRSDAQIYHLLHPDRGITIEADERLVDLARRYQDFKGAVKAYQGDIDLVKAEILQALGEASSAALPDGNVLARKIVHRKAYTSVVKPTSFSKISISKPGRA